ncbi:MAG: zinc ribbon domain-containing protein [Anaerolineales bacterium]|jgi:hypothetical protein
MKCFNCGEVVPEGQNFCGNCGAPQAADPSAAPLQAASTSGDKSSSRTWLWVLLGCGGLIVVSCCLGFVLLFVVGGLVSESTFDALDQIATFEPELFDESFQQVATVFPEQIPLQVNTPTTTVTSQTLCGELGLTTEPWLQVELVCEQVPAQTETNIMAAPGFTRVTLENYPISPTFHEPQISLFPVAEYQDLNEEASDRIDQLQNLLEERPIDPLRPYPFLPVWNAGQSIAVQLEYIDFDGGEGIRYLTQYGQAAWPINNQDLFYTFQGLTSDGQYYLSAVLPVTHPELPPDGDSYIGEEYETFIGTYASYLEDIETQLETSATKAFNPNLSALDAVMQSFSVR